MSDKAQSLGISVFHEIKRDILMATLPPCQKLGLKMLSDRYNCGNSPIREALNQLTVEGWVQRIDKRGYLHMVFRQRLHAQWHRAVHCGNSKILVDVRMEHGNIAESTQPFRMLDEFRKVEFVDDAHGSVTATCA